MQKAIIATCAMAFLAIFSVPAYAGSSTDELSKCIVTNTTDKDKISFGLFMFSALSAHPTLKIYSSMTDVQRDAAIKAAVSIFDRQFFTDCRKQAVEALKQDGPTALSAAFGIMGQSAMRDLMSNDQVSMRMSSISTFTDQDKLSALAKEAGLAAE